MSTICTICTATLSANALTCACGAQRGYRDGKGIIRSKTAFALIGAACAGFSIVLLWLAAQMPIGIYYYPLTILGVWFALGTLIIAAMLIRGPKWYPS